MALDGIFLYALRREVEAAALGARVEKVHQPTREEIVLQLRARSGAYKLLLSARANSPRIHFTRFAPENPQKPPMLCMLLRKHLTGAILRGVRQAGLDRVLFLDFDATNEIGEQTRLTLCVEIMARHSNLILLDGAGTILDAVKRVDSAKSSVREVLPGLSYALPPAQDKASLLDVPPKLLCERIAAQTGTVLSGAILRSVQGVSPIVCRELAFRACGSDLRVEALTAEQTARLETEFADLCAAITREQLVPCAVADETGKPMDFSFLPIRQYGSHVQTWTYESFSELLDAFFYERDRLERTRQRAGDLFRLVSNATERIARKLNAQRAELLACADRDQLRIYAELINANQYRLEKGVPYYEVENYYEDNRMERIPADPALPPARMAQKYYKEYRKAHTAEQMLTRLIAEGEQELQYLETVSDVLSRADTERELGEIRAELAANGYGKLRRDAKQKPPKALPPLRFRSDDGFIILVGRNNVQNDRLSLKQAAKSDLWLHTKNIPGSHVILSLEGGEPTETALHQAAVLAAYYSKAREGAQVPVDYTAVRNLKKPQGAKPGKVIYHTNRTLVVDPDRELAQRLAVEE